MDALMQPRLMVQDVYVERDRIRGLRADAVCIDEVANYRVSAIDSAAGIVELSSSPRAGELTTVHVGVDNVRNFSAGDEIQSRIRSYANLMANAPMPVPPFPRGGARDDDEEDEETPEVAPAPPVPVNPVGGSGADQGRDGWCTPLWLADVVSGDYEVDLDPCSNDRSNILAKRSCTLGRGNGLPAGYPPYSFIGEGETGVTTAKASWRVFINPPYARGQVIRWIRHWMGTDFIFLLRWAPDTEWFGVLWPRCWGAWFPKKCEVNPSGRINFEPPPGVESSSNPFPHALYLKTEPRGKFLDRLLATGYLVRNDARQVETQPTGGANDTPAAAAVGGGGNGAAAGGSAFSGIARTAGPAVWATAGVPEPDICWYVQSTASPRPPSGVRGRPAGYPANRCTCVPCVEDWNIRAAASSPASAEPPG